MNLAHSTITDTSYNADRTLQSKGPMNVVASMQDEIRCHFWAARSKEPIFEPAFLKMIYITSLPFSIYILRCLITKCQTTYRLPNRNIRKVGFMFTWLKCDFLSYRLIWTLKIWLNLRTPMTYLSKLIQLSFDKGKHSSNVEWADNTQWDLTSSLSTLQDKVHLILWDGMIPYSKHSDMVLYRGQLCRNSPP